MNKKILILGLTFFALTGLGQTKSAGLDRDLKAEDFQCGKVLGKSLSDFKADLLASCDLNKPFSTSLTRLLNEDTYLYCCHKKK